MSPFNQLSLSDNPFHGHTQVFTNINYRNRGLSSFSGRHTFARPSEASLTFQGRRQEIGPNPSYWNHKSGSTAQSNGSDGQPSPSKVVVQELEMDTGESLEDEVGTEEKYEEDQGPQQDERGSEQVDRHE